MQTLTFTQKLLRQRGFLRALIPLFALFVGLGASQTAAAQSVVSNSVTINERGTVTTYDTQAAGPGAGVFNGRNFGTFDLSIPSDVFNINSVSFVINDPTNTYDEAQFLYRIDNTTTGVNGAFSNVQLGAGVFSGGVRTFNLSPNINLLAGLAGGSGNNYVLRVFFRANDNNNGGSQLSSAPAKTATFAVINAPTPPTGFAGTQVLLDIDGVDPKNTNTTYDASAQTAAPDFQGATLGNFDINNGELFLNGGIANTFESGGDRVVGVRLFYRVRKDGALTPPGGFTNFALGGGSTVTNGNRTFSLTTAQRNLIAGLANSGTGGYIIETYFELDRAKAGGTFDILRDDRGTLFYGATFNTIGTPIVTITWTGGVNDDWFTAGNWDLNMVPTAITNVVIPDFGPSNNTAYPNINSNTTYTTSNGIVKNNNTSGPALARNLSLNGGSQALRSILRVIVGRLKVYGDFSNQFDSFIMRDNTVLELAGSNQSITGGSGFPNVVISGGGTKRVINSMVITESFTFDNANGGGIFTTDISQPTTSFIELADRNANNNNQGAQLIGETETSYVRGFIKTNRANVLANEPTARTFGGIGMDLLFTGANNPGDVLVTRNTAESYTPLGNKFSIRRIFGVRPSAPNTNSGGLTATMTFHYLDNETVNLGPGGTGSIPEPNLTIFVSTNSGGSFGLIGRDGPPNTTANTVTKTGVRAFATITLGDTENPLPVRLTAFNAKRVGTDALVTWATASELNSKGYDVQVSTNGKEFRTLASIASANPNTNRTTEYRYIDAEANKNGTRYYRLRQVDLDGKETFFAPVAVSFTGKSVETALVAYPNPFNGNDELRLAFQSANAGKGQLIITDLAGRVVRKQTLDVAAGTSDLAIDKLNDLNNGIYMVRLTLPSGQVQNLKVVKQ